jgi:glycosyltransferase involved in cell wall biosynthesis
MNDVALKVGDPAIAAIAAGAGGGAARTAAALRFGVDARMLFATGIGTVIRNVLGRWHESRSGSIPHLLVPGAAGKAWAATNLPDFPSTRADVPIYTIREQVVIPMQTRRNEVFWSPHFNVPLASPSRVVVTIHDVLHLAHPEFFPGALSHVYSKGMLAGAVKLARRIIAVSDFTASELVRHTGVDRSRIRVVHNGVSSRWFIPKAGPSPHPRPYFLFVGNVKPHKNLVRLIDAFSLISDSLKDHDLVIVGKKEGLITMDREAAKAAVALGDRVIFTGYLDDATLDRYVSHAEALVYPSLYEGFGLPPLEAMAAGCPVVASDIPALRESCGSQAVFCDPLSSKSVAGALEAITMFSADERASLISAGRQRARQFSWEKTARGTMDIVEDAAA